MCVCVCVCASACVCLTREGVAVVSLHLTFAEAKVWECLEGNAVILYLVIA